MVAFGMVPASKLPFKRIPLTVIETMPSAGLPSSVPVPVRFIGVPAAGPYPKVGATLALIVRL